MTGMFSENLYSLNNLGLAGLAVLRLKQGLFPHLKMQIWRRRRQIRATTKKKRTNSKVASNLKRDRRVNRTRRRGAGEQVLCVNFTKYLILYSAPAWKIEEEAKKSDHVRGKKGKMKKMKEKYKDQVKFSPISHFLL